MRVGFVGWRGMVGSVLLDRMREESDFDGLESVFFSTSNVGGAPPEIGFDAPVLADAYDLDTLASLDVIVTCQGGDYSLNMHDPLRARGWKGYWIDAASALRMRESSVIVLDPINRALIDRALVAGGRDFIGGNCTVSLMLMAVAGLYRRGWLEWVHAMTYQAASGAGAAQMRELVAQMRFLGQSSSDLLDRSEVSALTLERSVTALMRGEAFPSEALGVPLAGSVLAWIDKKMEDGRSREEWKGQVESAKILGLADHERVPVDGICVRVGALRCHSQALTLGLKREIPLADIEAEIAQSTPWTRFIPNDKDATLSALTPTAVTGTLDVAIGRVRTMVTSPRHIAAFTVGDQLLWGAAEPLRRMLRIVREHEGR